MPGGTPRQASVESFLPHPCRDLGHLIQLGARACLVSPDSVPSSFCSCWAPHLLFCAQRMAEPSAYARPAPPTSSWASSADLYVTRIHTMDPWCWPNAFRRMLQQIRTFRFSKIAIANLLIAPFSTCSTPTMTEV